MADDDKLVRLLDEAYELRHGVTAGDINDSLPLMHAHLVRAGQARDRLDTILATFIRVAGQTRGQMIEAKDAYEDAWQKVATAKSVGFQDYSTAKAKDADVDAKVMGEKFALRRAEKQDREMQSAMDYVKHLHRGVDSVRRDLELRVRIITTESRLQ